MWSASAAYELDDRPVGAFGPLGELRGGRWRPVADPWGLAIELQEPSSPRAAP
jgi:hypothetical protein